MTTLAMLILAVLLLELRRQLSPPRMPAGPRVIRPWSERADDEIADAEWALAIARMARDPYRLRRELVPA